MGYLWYLPFMDLRITRKILNRCLLGIYPNNEVLFIYDTVVVNLGHFSLLVLKLE
jgi:hypothetical protein